MKSPFAKLAGVVLLLMIAVYAIVALQGSDGLPGLMEKHRLIHEYTRQNEDLAKKNEQQRARINRLSDSSSDQDLQIRERLKLVKPGEKVFMLDDSPSNPNAK